jgi:uncharacterized protein YlaI
MRVKCALCDVIETINDETLIAKRLRNRPIHTYMCKPCQERIEQKTNERVATGNFRLFREKKLKEEW